MTQRPDAGEGIERREIGPSMDLLQWRRWLGLALEEAVREVFPAAPSISPFRVVEAGVCVDVRIPADVTLEPAVHLSEAWIRRVQLETGPAAASPHFRLGSFRRLARPSEPGSIDYRVHGIVFRTWEALSDYLEKSERARSWDHARLGAAMKLFRCSGQGREEIQWLPAGREIKRLLGSAIEEISASRGGRALFRESGPRFGRERAGHGLWSMEGGPASCFVVNETSEDLSLRLHRWVQAGQDVARLLGFGPLKVRVVHANSFAACSMPLLLERICRERGIACELRPGWQGPSRATFWIENAIGRECALGWAEETISPRTSKEREKTTIDVWLPPSSDHVLAALLEHRGGHLPTWLAPVQACVLPANAPRLEYAKELAVRLHERGLRVTVPTRGGTLSGGIKNAIRNKIPHLVIVGEREARRGMLSWRRRWPGGQREIAMADFAAELEQRVMSRVWDCDPPMQNNPEIEAPGRR